MRKSKSLLDGSSLSRRTMNRCAWKNGLLSHPINCVTWEEAAAFCTWVGGRLPTPTEWEYAATSGDPEKQYPWGESPPDGSHANYCNVNCPKALGKDGKNLETWEKRGWIDRTQNDGWAATSPVGTYPAGATPWGLLDMAGNLMVVLITQRAHRTANCQSPTRS